MVEKYYLRKIKTKQTNCDSFEVYLIDYRGREFYGKFSKNYLKDNMLEIRVVSFVENSDWAWIQAKGGFFIDNNEKENECIPVEKNRIIGIIDH